MIESESNLSIRRQTQLLAVPRSSYYAKGCADESAENLAIMAFMDREYLDHPTTGIRKLVRLLVTAGIIEHVNPKRIRRLRRKMGLQTVYRRPRTTIPGPGKLVKPYLLRAMEITRPNQVWCTDITYIRMSRGFMYLTVVMDWYSRCVLSWRLSNTMETRFCLEALEAAIEHTGTTPEIVNSDQGCQYTSEDWIKALESRDIKVSMDGKGCWIDNVIVERFWRTIKYDEVYLRDDADGIEARHYVGRFISYYNGRRPHASLSMKTPDVVYTTSAPIDKVAA